MLARARPSDIEGEAHDAFDAAAGEDRGFGGNFLGQAAMRASALAGILAFRIFPHDHPVQIADVDITQRGGDAGQDAGWPNVGILVEALADLQPQAPQGDVVGDVRVADGAEIDSVVLADFFLPVLRHHAAVLFVIVAGGEVEIVELQLEAEFLRRRFEHAHALRHDFLADAVAGNDGDAVNAVGAHGK